MLTGLEVPVRSGGRQAAELLEEIALLEARLRDMGHDGDCAYERAMSRLYRTMVVERRRRLKSLQAETVRNGKPVA